MSGVVIHAVSDNNFKPERVRVPLTTWSLSFGAMTRNSIAWRTRKADADIKPLSAFHAFFCALQPISTNLRIASDRFGRSGSRRRQSSTFFAHVAGTTMWMRAISSSSFFGIWNPDLCCVSFAYVYNTP